MQDVATWGSNVQEGQTVTAVDERDGNTYRVRRLKDGKLWMVDNLRLGDSKLINRTLSSSNTDLNGISSYSLPTSTTSFSDNASSAPAQLDATYANNNSTVAGWSLKTNSASTTQYGVGVYYNWYAATAGTGTYSMSSGDASSSICPKGWKLPKGGSSGDFQTLYSSYDSTQKIRDEDGPNFLLSGYLYTRSRYDTDSLGYYWSRSAYNSYSAYYLGFHSSSVGPAYSNYKYYGFPIRCVAK